MPPQGENPYTRCAGSVSCIYWRVRPGPKGPGFLPLLYSKKEGRTTQFLLRMNSQVSLRHISMNDLISRQAAIDAVLDRMNVEKYGRNAKPEEIQWALEELPSAQPEPKWIPCSERLPEEDGLYLVTSREKATAEEFGFDLDDVEVKKMRFNEDGWRIPKHIPEWINGVVHTTVLAWMPLPEPYKEGAQNG